jgi:preprotein translocase subunit SecE
METTTVVMSWPQQTKSYIEEVKAEMRRVSWPTWKQVRATTGVVIGAVFLLAAYFWVIDTIFSSILTRLINSLTGR